MKEFKNRLDLFYNETEANEPTNETQVKDRKDRIVVLDTVSELYNELLEICTNQFIKAKYDQKKKDKPIEINVKA